MGVIVARVEFGEVKERRVVEGRIEEVVRSVVLEALELWDPKSSDLVITREKLSNIRPELPAYGEVEVYVISYDIEWRDDNVIDRRFFIVMENLGEISLEAISELAYLSRVGAQGSGYYVSS